MTQQPRLLDLFCGAGGSAMGYARAGFRVTGADIAAQPHYPLFDIVQADARVLLTDRDFMAGFDAVHASPPCKLYTALRTRANAVPEHLRTKWDAGLLDDVRAMLERCGKPYVIENVVGAPLRDPVTLCGSMFGLGLDLAVLKRHRLFESNVPLVAPGPDRCAGRRVVGVYGTGGAWTRTAPGGGGVKVAGADAARALGIDWTAHQAALAQAIPPAYTEWIGQQLFQRVTTEAA